MSAMSFWRRLFGRREPSVPGLVIFQVQSKDTIEALDMTGIEGLLALVTEAVRKNGTFQPCNLSVTDYNDDPRELFQIPEVRAWCKRAFEIAPVLPLLLSEDSVKWFVWSLVNVEVVAHGVGETQVKVPRDEVMDIVKTSLLDAQEFFWRGDLEKPKRVEKLSGECVHRLILGLGYGSI